VHEHRAEHGEGPLNRSFPVSPAFCNGTAHGGNLLDPVPQGIRGGIDHSADMSVKERAATEETWLRAAGSAIAALTASALHRRTTTGGPIFTENAPCAFRYASIGSSHRASSSGSNQSITGPSGRYARYRLSFGSGRNSTSPTPPSRPSPSNHPRLSARQSGFTSPQEGT
jgi:hypothetical protein